MSHDNHEDVVSVLKKDEHCRMTLDPLPRAEDETKWLFPEAVSARALASILGLYSALKRLPKT